MRTYMYVHRYTCTNTYIRVNTYVHLLAYKNPWGPKVHYTGFSSKVSDIDLYAKTYRKPELAVLRMYYSTQNLLSFPSLTHSKATYTDEIKINQKYREKQPILDILVFR